MLEKKDVIQKSFRIEKQNDIQLSKLAAILDRTQNELVNIAIKMLIDDNKKWFFDDFITEKFYDSIYKTEVTEQRIGNIEVIVLPRDLANNVSITQINVTYYKDDKTDEIESHDAISVDYGPGIEFRIREELLKIYESVIEEYPDVMKDYKVSGTNFH